ncbi:hypothetical protein [Geminicoccus harenae]|uniref:hypothetical protein n=1 Tax=Geminicoccus harenae TaxID=2498453 RepID=UPI00168A4145|nr:hypothetical protein [Geminicoccus harenae]
MPKFGGYTEAGTLDGSEVLVVKKGTDTRRTTAGDVAGLVTLPEQHFDAADPTGDDGTDGDTWTNTTSGDVFKKEAGEWSLKWNAKGPPGDDGQDGDDSTVAGPPGPPGALFLGVTRWENDDTRIGADFSKPGLYTLSRLADPEADPPVTAKWDFLRSTPPAIPYRDTLTTDTVVEVTSADLWRVLFIYGAPANNAEVTVNIPRDIWMGPDLAPLWIQIGTNNPVKFVATAPEGQTVNFRNPANGQTSNTFTIAAGNRWKWVNILTLGNVHRVL